MESRLENNRINFRLIYALLLFVPDICIYVMNKKNAN